MDNLIEVVKNYYEKRGLVWPNFDNAMKFVMTEIAEVFELDIARSGNWVRNNPQNKPKFNKQDLAEELGDAIFMLIVAGITEEVDPIEAMVNKMNRKLGAGGEKKVVGTSQLELFSEEIKTEEDAQRAIEEVNYTED